MNFNALQCIGLGIAMTLALSSCKKDEITDPVIPNEEEIITTLQYTLSPIGGGTSIIMNFYDIDGDGPEAPTSTVSGSLTANSEYTASLLLLNETVSPADTINAEILAEDEEHQFFFSSDDVNVDVMYNDEDEDGNPLGLASLVSTGAPSEGSLSIILRHEPDKFATGVAQGDITNAGGESDIETSFDISIE